MTQSIWLGDWEAFCKLSFSWCKQTHKNSVSSATRALRAPQVSRRWIGAGRLELDLALVIVAIVAYSGAKHSLNVSTKGLVTTQLSNDFDLSSVSTISGMSPETQKAVQAAQLAAQTASPERCSITSDWQNLASSVSKRELAWQQPMCWWWRALWELVLCKSAPSSQLDWSRWDVPLTFVSHWTAMESTSASSARTPLNQFWVRHLWCHAMGMTLQERARGKKRCPHTPGACLKDEELYLGTCFKQCSILTNRRHFHTERHSLLAARLKAFSSA